MVNTGVDTPEDVQIVCQAGDRPLGAHAQRKQAVFCSDVVYWAEVGPLPSKLCGK